MNNNLILLVLGVGVIASLVQIVEHRHTARLLFVEWQDLKIEQVELGREWGRLLLEQGTLVTHGRIEEVARQRLNMTLPERKNILFVGSR